MDEHLSWLTHISYVQNHVSRNIGIISRIRPFVNTKVALLLYFSSLPLYNLLQYHMGFYLQHTFTSIECFAKANYKNNFLVNTFVINCLYIY